MAFSGFSTGMPLLRRNAILPFDPEINTLYSGVEAPTRPISGTAGDLRFKDAREIVEE